MFDQNFLSPQVKQSAVISSKHGLCELPHEFPKRLETWDFRKLGKVRKISKDHRIIT